MFEAEAPSRLDEIEEDIADLRERIGRYRRAMIGSRVVIAVGAALLVAMATLFPASAPVVVSAIAAVIGATVWLGATRSSAAELDARLARIEAERDALFDRVALTNGWDRPRSHWPTRH